jgi:hypothetical protein
MNALNKNIHIKNGHVIDPANGIDGLNDLYIADGKVLAVGAAGRLQRRRNHRRHRPDRGAGPGRPVGAPARAGL